jgi:hypothetical protein
LSRFGLGEVTEQFKHVPREGIWIAVQRAPQRARGRLVRARRTAEPQVDPAGKQGLKRAELLGHLQWRVVWEHDPPAPTRIEDVPAATWQSATEVAALAIPGME